jgi:CDP-glycerol glycerophosphotransferase
MKVKQYLKNFPRIYSGVQRIFYILVLLPRYKINKGFILLLTHIFIKLPIKKNKIVMANFNGNGFGCNLKYIAEEIIRQNLNYDIVWLIKKELKESVEIPSPIRMVEFRSIRHYYELATAKIWIDNERKSIYTPKRKEQYYIQTWHGVVALKQIEKDVEKQLPSHYIAKAKNDSKMIDLLISNSEVHTDLFKRAFWYEGEILEIGAPRSEILVNRHDISKKVLSYFNFKGKNILLYAPTFRDKAGTEVYNIDFDRLLKALEKKYGGDWIILVRLHPDVSTKVNFFEYNKKVFNATDYEDMNELLSVSDILITDYSSCMFDFSITKKPIFLYAPDITEYIEERNFYFDIHSLPYPLAENNDQLQRLIEGYDKSSYLKELNVFLNELGIFDSIGASAKIVKIIENVSRGNLELYKYKKIRETI